MCPLFLILLCVMNIPHNHSLLSTRFMESGCYRGFLNAALHMFMEHKQLEDKQVIPWRLYTDMDFKLQQNSIGRNPPSMYLLQTLSAVKVHLVSFVQ